MNIPYEILEDTYLHYDDSILYDETDILKDVIFQLTDEDRKIMILYTHYHSLRKVGDIIGVSHSKVGSELKRIKNTIIENLTNYTK